jgi:hypothetical protein
VVVKYRTHHHDIVDIHQEIITLHSLDGKDWECTRNNSGWYG